MDRANADDLRFGYVAANGVHLHVVEAGPRDGPLVILLHGFPEFWFCWRGQIGALAAAGCHVVVPDQRGYNLSDKPAAVAAYDIDVLAADVIALADHYGAARFGLAGHDWGAVVGFWTAQNHPSRVARLIALGAGHPAVWRAHMREDPVQRRKSWYVAAFQLPWLPERLMALAHYRMLADAIRQTARPDAVSEAELARYRTAWAQPGALTGGVNWYRAAARHRFPDPATIRIRVPTTMVWGLRDRYGTPALARDSAALCDQGTVVLLDQATHWLLQDEPARVAELLRAGFA